MAKVVNVDLGFRPRPWQFDCFKSLKRFSVIVVHRRGGKTVMSVAKLTDAALRCKNVRGRYGYIAPQLKQAKGAAWDYIKDFARKVPGTTINESELYVEYPNGARVRVYGADNPDSLRGLYFDGVVLDEVAQMKPELWGEVVRPTLADRNGWALFIGTPKGINLFSKLYFDALRSPEWFAALYTVNDTDALSRDETEKIKAELSANEFRQEMLCDFSASTDNTLITIDQVEAASHRHIYENEYEFAPKILGIDVAWEGGDRNVIFPRQGLVAFRPKVIPGIPEKNFVPQIANAYETWQADYIFIDTTGGYGGEVASRLTDLGYPIQRVVFSWEAENARFKNLRAEMWWKVADWIKNGGSIPNIPQLKTELCSPTYNLDNSSNKFQLESKKNIKARIGVSPDIADALAITFAFPVAPLSLIHGIHARNFHAKTEYDPFSDDRVAA